MAVTQNEQSVLEMAWRPSYEKFIIARIHFQYLWDAKLSKNVFLLKVHKSVRGWIEVRANPYIAIRTITTPEDPWGPSSKRFLEVEGGALGCPICIYTPLKGPTYSAPAYSFKGRPSTDGQASGQAGDIENASVTPRSE